MRKVERAAIDPKAMVPQGHVGPRRWWKYIARNPPLGKVMRPERYLHASARAADG
jgi:hypothetical protein